MTNTGVTYYFINDFNQICRQKNGADAEFSEVIDIQDLINDINHYVEENEQLLKEKIDVETKLYQAHEQLLMQIDYDAVIKQNEEDELKIINLKKENEQLKKELNAFKPVMFQDMRKGTVILYQKGDVE